MIADVKNDEELTIAHCIYYGKSSELLIVKTDTV